MSEAIVVAITPEMLKADRDALLSSFPEDVLSDGTAGLYPAVLDIFLAMLARSEQLVPEEQIVLPSAS